MTAKFCQTCGINQFLYSKEFEEMVKKRLKNAEASRRVSIYEWRNFIDYDIIPIFKDLLEK